MCVRRSTSSADDTAAFVYDRHGVALTVENEALKAIFSQFDRNHSGSIDRDELMELCMILSAQSIACHLQSGQLLQSFVGQLPLQP